MFPTTQNSATNLAQALTNSQVQSAQNNSGKAFIKFDFKSGDFCYGRDADDITGDEIVVNTYSLTHGWVLWVNGQANKTLVPFNQPLPEAPAGQAGAEPSEARGFEARFTDDEDTVLVFETNSYGGRQGVDALLNAIKGRALSGEEKYLFPKVQLSSSSYKHKQGNTIHNPDFIITGWLDVEGNEEQKVEALEAAPEQAEEVKPVRRRRA